MMVVVRVHGKKANYEWTLISEQYISGKALLSMSAPTRLFCSVPPSNSVRAFRYRSDFQPKYLRSCLLAILPFGYQGFSNGRAYINILPLLALI
jgi:hypothetical protein